MIGSCKGDAGGALRFSRQVAQGHLSRSSRIVYSRSWPSLQVMRKRPSAASSSLVGCGALIDKTLSLSFETRQRHSWYAVDVDLETQPQLHFFSDPRRLLQVIFYFNDELVHNPLLAGSDSVFNDFWKAVKYLLDRRRID